MSVPNPPPQEIKVEGKAARIRGATWTQDQVKKLFDVWTQPDIYQGLLNEKKKLDIFKNMATILSSRGVSRTWRECRAKIKNLKADFRKAVEKKTPFRYYEEMKHIMNFDESGVVTRTTTRTIDSFFTSRASSTTSSQAEYRHEHRYPEHTATHTPAETVTSAFPHSSPSTSRSVIQHASTHSQHSQASSHDSQDAFSWRQEDDDSSHHARSTPPPSTSKSPSMVDRSPHMPHTYHQYEFQQNVPSNRDDENRQTWSSIAGTEEYYPHGHHELGSRQDENKSTSDNLVEHDSSSRSSMIITHVVSNVIEPVTQIVMPSSCGSAGSRSIPEDSDFISQSAPQDGIQEATPPPIRLEFLLDDENIILQSPHTPENVPPEADDDAAVLSPSPPHTVHIETTPSTPPATQSPKIPRERLKKQSQSKVSSSPSKPSSSSLTDTPKRPTTFHRKRKPVPPKSADENKKRKLLETMNRKTIETISDLLTETSQNLLKELQDAEQRFIVWEEEKRSEERKREEIMFTKLIEAMKHSSTSTSIHLSSPEVTAQTPGTSDSEITMVSNFSSMSKRINEMVCGEVKQTEESLRQWELKMQRQESRHTEKLFGIIINAIRTSNTSPTHDS